MSASVRPAIVVVLAAITLPQASATLLGAGVGLQGLLTWKGEADLVGGCPTPFVSMVHTGQAFALPNRLPGELVLGVKADAEASYLVGDVAIDLTERYVGPGPVGANHFYAPALVLVSYETWCYQNVGFGIRVIRFSGYGAGVGTDA